MQVLLARPRGFCAGVDRAIEIVERALELHGAPIYVRHEVVHNKYVVEDLRACQDMTERGLTGLDVVKALDAGGFRDVAENLFNMLRQRVAGDLLQTSAIIDSTGQPLSAIAINVSSPGREKFVIWVSGRISWE